MKGKALAAAMAAMIGGATYAGAPDRAAQLDELSRHANSLAKQEYRVQEAAPNDDRMQASLRTRLADEAPVNTHLQHQGGKESHVYASHRDKKRDKSYFAAGYRQLTDEQQGPWDAVELKVYDGKDTFTSNGRENPDCVIVDVVPFGLDFESGYDNAFCGGREYSVENPPHDKTVEFLDETMSRVLGSMVAEARQSKQQQGLTLRNAPREIRGEFAVEDAKAEERELKRLRKLLD